MWKLKSIRRGHGLTNFVAAIQNQINIMNLSICFVWDWWFVLVFLLLSFMYSVHLTLKAALLWFSFITALFLSYFANQLAMLELIDWLSFWHVVNVHTKEIQWTFCRAFKYENSVVFVKFVRLLIRDRSYFVNATMSGVCLQIAKRLY